jgi:hypothetical protein
VEVPLNSAQHGDIIQLVDDRNTSPGADYPGLHTAIVLDNLGGGKFRVVESNVNFDGMVSIRESFDPVAGARRYSNISVHVYRLPGSPVRASAVQPGGAVTGPAIPIAPGVTAIIMADGDCLRVRAAAGLSATVLGCVATGSRVTVTQVGSEADGFHWSRVSAGAIGGWVADKYLRGVATEAASAPSAPSAPAAPPEPPKPPSTEGKILAGSLPSNGLGLLVYGGGSMDQLVEAAECGREAVAFWASLDGEFVAFVPAATIAVVNAAWNAKFGEGIPPSTALVGRCGIGSTPAPPVTPDAASAEQSKPEAAAADTPTTTESEGPAASDTPTDPSSPPSPTGGEGAGVPANYVVAEGDTLSGIASRFRPADVELYDYIERLRVLNGLDEDSVLSLGAELRLRA